MTAQIHEELRLDGVATTMATCPPLPLDHPRVCEPEPARSLDELIRFLGTDCRRRYRGTWEIKDGWLFLVAIRGRYALRDGEPILADWFTGELRVPVGPLVCYVHMGFGSIYEEERRIRIERGRVVGEERKATGEEWRREGAELRRER